MSPIDHDDAEHDAWLHEALRHAPDADATPPAALSETILKQARAATAAAPVPRAASRWAVAWARLAHPPIAAGFASVMAATLVGLMWWDRPMDEALPRAPALERPQAAATEPPRPAPDAGSDKKLAPPAPAETTTDATRAAAPQAPPPPRPQPRATRRAGAAVDAAKESAPAQRPEPVPFESERKDAPESRPAAAPPAPAPAAPNPLRMRDAAPAAADESTPVTRNEASAASAAPSAGLATRALAKAAAPPPATALALQQSEDRGSPLAAALASIAEQPQRWAGQRSGTAQEAMTASLQRWLKSLDAATVSRWRAAANMVPSDSSTVVRLYADGVLRFTLYLDDGGVWFISPDASSRNSRAALSAAVSAALRRSLDEAAR